jgi:hypothetical protein
VEDLAVLESVSNIVGDFINCVYFKVDDENLFKERYQGSLPQFRTFRNKIKGQRKKEQSYEIQFSGQEMAD